ncbi:MAG: hypothetical protein MUF10_14200 [Thermoanaerobaculaceae bacterium]|jgi:hypothetical protein|nr:hypothetical protein [Thermoanaerobaculaceae bacterium]
MTGTQSPTAFQKAIGEITGTVRAFVHSPRAMWGVNVPYFLEGIAYFGVLMTGLYAGWFLQHYCPAEGAKHTEQMWLIYACIAMVSPVALLLTRRWLRQGAAKTESVGGR